MVRGQGFPVRGEGAQDNRLDRRALVVHFACAREDTHTVMQEVVGSSPIGPAINSFCFNSHLPVQPAPEAKTWVHLGPNTSLSTLSTARRCSSGTACK